MQLSVIILNYNVSCFLHLCLESVFKSIEGIDAEVIVVDNNSPDDSVEMVKTNFPKATLLENKDNVGFAKANNQGVALAKGEYVCILNPDTVVSETTFVNALQKAHTLPNMGALGVQLIDGKGRYLPESKRNLPTPKVAIHKILGNKFSKKAAYYANHVLPDSEGAVTILVGAFMLLKKSLYEKVGGFDERYFMYGEDIDLSYTIEKLGYQNYYYGLEKVIHFKGESTFKNAVYRKRFYGAMNLFYVKHFKSSIFRNAIFFTGIKLSAVLGKVSKKSDELSFNSCEILSKKESLVTLIQQKTKIKTALTTVNKVYANHTLKQPVLCFLDLNEMSFSQAILLIHSNCNGLYYFRFLVKSNKIALGSDTSVGRGQVISL